MKATGAGDYAKGIRDLVRGAWRGELEYFSFVDGMVSALQRGLTRAWYEGAAECGIKPSELTSQEIGEVSAIINQEIGYITNFADAIYANSKDNGGKLGPLLGRASMWGNRYEAVRGRAMTSACSDKKYKWVVDPAKESCATCLKLNGRVYRGSIWRKYDIYPKHRSLL